MSEASDKRHRQMMGIFHAEWDSRPMVLASEIRKFLESVKDAGSEIDSGGGNGLADLWVTVDGTEYLVSISPSRSAET